MPEVGHISWSETTARVAPCRSIGFGRGAVLSDNDSRCSFRICWRSRCFLAHARIEFVVLEFSHEMPATRRVHAACAVRSASPY